MTAQLKPGKIGIQADWPIGRVKMVREGPIEIIMQVSTRTVFFLSLFSKSLLALNPAIIAPGTDRANMRVNSSGNHNQKKLII